MKDLIIDYTTQNNTRIHAEYNTIMDFLDVIDYNLIDIRVMNYTNVEADFFENPRLHKSFDTIQSLYHHCLTMLC